MMKISKGITKILPLLLITLLLANCTYETVAVHEQAGNTGQENCSNENNKYYINMSITESYPMILPIKDNYEKKASASTFDTTEEFNLIITASVPDKIASYHNYVIENKFMYDRFDCNYIKNHNIAVEIDKDGVKLEKYKDYNLTLPTDFTPTFSFELTPFGKLKLENINAKNIKITLKTRLYCAGGIWCDPNIAYPNTATLSCTDSENKHFSTISNTVYAAHLGIQFAVVDSISKIGLNNVSFELYNNEHKISLCQLLDGHNVVPDDYNLDDPKTKVTTITSMKNIYELGAPGYIRIEGLANKEYTLKEVNAPAGYKANYTNLKFTPTAYTFSRITDPTGKDNSRIILYTPK